MKQPQNHNSSTLEILYEDDWLLVVNKPSGMLTMSTGRADETTAYRLLTDHVNQKRGSRGRQRVFIVHRLDRDTSGVLVFAKDVRSKEILQSNWEDIVERREYIAVLEGTMEDSEGEIRTYLRDDPNSYIVHCSDHDNGGKVAISYLRVLSQGPQYALVSFNLDTGRKNQIRAHAAWIGHPVAGDRKYGASSSPIGRMCLHARTLVFRHPVTGEQLRFRCEEPRSFKRLVRSQ